MFINASFRALLQPIFYSNICFSHFLFSFWRTFDEKQECAHCEFYEIIDTLQFWLKAGRIDGHCT
jgi:hypothetical protein